MSSSPRSNVKKISSKGNFKKIESKEEFDSALDSMSTNMKDIFKTILSENSKDKVYKIQNKEYTKKEINKIFMEYINNAKKLPTTSKGFIEKVDKTKEEFLEYNLKMFNISVNTFIKVVNIENPETKELLKEKIINYNKNKINSKIYRKNIFKGFFIKDELKNFLKEANFGNGYCYIYKSHDFPKEVKNINGKINQEEAYNKACSSLGFDISLDLKLKTKHDVLILADPHVFLDTLIENYGILNMQLLFILANMYFNVEQEENLLIKHFKEDRKKRREVIQLFNSFRKTDDCTEKMIKIVNSEFIEQICFSLVNIFKN